MIAGANEPRRYGTGVAPKEVTAMEALQDVLTDEEVDCIIYALLEGQGPAGATDEEMEAAVTWARKTRINNYLLDLVLDEKLVMRLEDGGGFRFAARQRAPGVSGTTGSGDGPDTPSS